MGMEDINNAAGAQNALTTRMNAFLDNIDADIVTRQAAYAALAGDLVGVVQTEMMKTYYVSPVGSDANDGTTSATPFATVGRVFDFVPNGASVDVRIESSEAEPFVLTACDAERRKVRFRPVTNAQRTYLNWRGSIGVYGGSINSIYSFTIDYDANEYSGSMFTGSAAAISFGGHDGWSVYVKNATNLDIVNSRYTYGGLNSIYMARINLLDAAGDPYAGTTAIFNRQTGAGLAAYELWQCSLGPNFVHAGLSVSSNSYIVG